MTSKFLTASIAILFSALAFSGTQFVQFTGSVVRDNMPATKFDISVPSGQTSKLILSDGTALEFFTANSKGNKDKTVIRLTDATGKQLHLETASGELESKSLQYVICGGNVTYISPASEKPATCQKS